MLRIAHMGAGNHSISNHGPAMKWFVEHNPGQVELAAVCDVVEEKARDYAEQFGFQRVYTDADEMLANEDIDGLLVISPVPLTDKMASDMLTRGIPMVIEKPPGANSDECRHMLSVAQATGTPHMISFNRRFSPAIQMARDWMADNAADRPPKVFIGRMVRFNRREDSFVWSTGIHIVDAMISLMGVPKYVDATSIPEGDPGVYYTQATLEYQSGARGHLFFSPTAGMLEETYELHGEEYLIKIETLWGAIDIWDHNEHVLSWQAPEDEILPWKNGTVGETEAFIQMLQGKRTWGPTLDEGLISLLTAEAIFRGGHTDISV